MLSYRGMTYCTYYHLCKVGIACDRALTDGVQAQADAWWGHEGAPIMTFGEKPKCFKKA